MLVEQLYKGIATVVLCFLIVSMSSCGGGQRPSPEPLLPKPLPTPTPAPTPTPKPTIDYISIASVHVVSIINDGETVSVSTYEN